MPEFASELISDPPPADHPRERVGRLSWMPWWLPTWVIFVTCVGVIAIGAAMLAVIKLPL